MCEGIYFTGYNFEARYSCVEYTINFNIDGMHSSSLKSFICNISDCILKQITFECIFIKNNTEINSNKTSSNKDNLQNQQNKDAGNASCFGSFLILIGSNVVFWIFILKKNEIKLMLLKKPIQLVKLLNQSVIYS